MTLQTFRTAAAFVSAAWRYWFSVFPLVRREIRRLRCEAQRIPDPVLRTLALDALRRKCASLEGAAAFATFAPAQQRAVLARLLIDLQAVFDYADTLMEQPSTDSSANARRLHTALLVALRPDIPHQEYYRYHKYSDDGGYLVRLVDVCRDSIQKLPSYQLVAPAVTTHVKRVLFYQSEINLATARDYYRLERWATREQQNDDDALAWWEIGAACGSSLAVFAHVTAAVDPLLTRDQHDATDALYWPWAEGLHILLDSLIDRSEDRQTAQHNLLDHYATSREMTERLELLARQAADRAKLLAPHHRLLLAGMTAQYLSDPNAWTPPVRRASERLLATMGAPAKVALFLLRARARLLRS